MQYVTLKRWCLPISPCGITTQKTNIDNFTAVRTSNLKPADIFSLLDYVFVNDMLVLHK
jgi:hypothetical protein